MLTTKRRLWFTVAAAGVLVAGSGCATKKYVTAKVTPVEQRVTSAEKLNTEQGTAIDELEKDQSRTRERVSDLDANVKQANERATDAGSRATQATNAAQQAQTQATDARKYAETRSNTLERFIESRDQMKLLKTQNVLFKYGRHELDDSAKATLEQLATEAKAMKRFVLEVQGFTDSTGSASRNLDLSQRRAETVVRYLTMQNVPLRSVHLIGSGSLSPVASNNDEQGRRQNRRVEVRLFAPEVESSSANTTAQLR